MELLCDNGTLNDETWQWYLRMVISYCNSTLERILVSFIPYWRQLLTFIVGVLIMTRCVAIPLSHSMARICWLDGPVLDW